MTNLKELEAQVKKEELELEKAKSDLAKAKKGKKKSSSGKSKKEKQREIEERLKKVDLRAAMGELKIKESNPALYAKELIEKASLMEMDKIEKAAASFLDREKNKDEEKKLKREIVLQQLESLGLDINSLKELIKGEV